MEVNIYLRGLFVMPPSLQGTTCSKLATETQKKNKVWKLLKIKNEDTKNNVNGNGIVLVSLLLTVNIFQIFFWLLTLNTGKSLLGSLKR